MLAALYLSIKVRFVNTCRFTLLVFNRSGELFPPTGRPLAIGALAGALLANFAFADEKAATLRGNGTGPRIVISQGDAKVPVVVVRGTPYEMGRQLGQLIGAEMRAFIPAAAAGITAG